MTAALLVLTFGGCPNSTVPANVPAADTPVDAVDLRGLVTAPVKDATPVVTAINEAQYTGSIAWKQGDADHSGNFAASTAYKAVVTLTAKAGFTFTGVEADAFDYSGADSVANAAGNGRSITVTVTFPKTAAEGENTPVNALSLTGLVTAPVKGATPVTTDIDAVPYAGSIAWKQENDSDFSGNFAASTVYKAVLTLTAKDGFTFIGVAEDAFGHAEATSVILAAVSGETVTVTITFKATAADSAAPQPDTTAPADVSGLTGTAGDGQVTLNWTNPTDADLHHIEISWDGGSYDTPDAAAATHTVTGLDNETAYAFTLKAVDKAGNKSAGVKSRAITPLALLGLVTIEFSLPQDETITVDPITNLISWTANTALKVSVGGGFTDHRWDLDGERLEGETGSSLTLYAEDLSIKRYKLTVFVKKNGVEYAKILLFTVRP
jgi:hypothetical protein